MNLRPALCVEEIQTLVKIIAIDLDLGPKTARTPIGHHRPAKSPEEGWEGWDAEKYQQQEPPK